MIDDYRVTERKMQDGSKDIVKDDWKKEEARSATSQLDGSAFSAVKRSSIGRASWTGTTTFTRKAEAPRRAEPARWSLGAMMLMTSCLAAAESVGVIEHEIYHIVEDPGGVSHLVDCEVPTEAYDEKLAEDMKKRRPKANKFLLEHLGELEPFWTCRSCLGLVTESIRRLWPWWKDLY